MKYSILRESSAVAFAEYDFERFMVTVSWKSHPDDYYHIHEVSPRQIQGLEESWTSLGKWMYYLQKNHLVTKV